jgi:hypothetical protein
MTFKFDITAGCFIRSDVRQQLQNSKQKLEFWYPGSKVMIIESSDWFDSNFHVEGKDFPKEAESTLKDWFKKIEKLAS